MVGRLELGRREVAAGGAATLLELHQATHEAVASST